MFGGSFGFKTPGALRNTSHLLTQAQGIQNERLGSPEDQIAPKNFKVDYSKAKITFESKYLKPNIIFESKKNLLWGKTQTNRHITRWLRV